MGSEQLPTGIIERIDHLANTQPDKIYASIPHDDSNLSKGFKDVTYLEFSAAINRAAWWLDEQLGSPQEAFEAFAYFGVSDLRWTALLVGGIKTGRRMMFCSPNVPVNGLEGLVEATNCGIFLYDVYPDEDSPPGQLRSSQKNARHILVPELSAWFPGKDDKQDHPRPYPYTKAWEDAIEDPVAVFHTSGSTKLPKPIVWTNRRFAYYEAVRELAKSEQDIFTLGGGGQRMYACFKASHIGGMMNYLFQPVYLDIVVVLGPSSQTPSWSIANDTMRYGRLDSIASPPLLLQQMVERPDVLEQLRKLKWIHTGAAILPDEEAETLTKDGGPDLSNIYGATETMPLIQMSVKSSDWPYLAFHSKSGVDFEHQHDEFYELVLKKPKDFEPPGVFSTFPELEEFRSGDLFSPHASKSDLWKYRGRQDDMISLINGQAICAAPMEQTIEQSPAVKSCLIGQEGRPALMLLLEPEDGKDAPQDRDKLIEKVWPSIEEANELGRRKTNIEKEMIFVVTQDKPLIKTAKGGVNRGKTLTAFKEEIDALYDSRSDK